MLRHIHAAALAGAVALLPAAASADGVTYYDGSGVRTQQPNYGVRQEDIGKILAGIAGAVIIGKLIEQSRDDDDRAERRRDRYDDRRDGLYDRRGDYWDDRLRDDRRHRGARGVGGTLPAACLREVRTSRGYERWIGRGCLERRDVSTARLPQHCATRIRTDRGVRAVYSPRCLRREGWRIG